VVDVHLGYCTSARLRMSQLPELQLVAIPETLSVGPEYGLALVKGAQPAATDLMLYILSLVDRRPSSALASIRWACQVLPSLEAFIKLISSGSVSTSSGTAPYAETSSLFKYLYIRQKHHSTAPDGTSGHAGVRACNHPVLSVSSPIRLYCVSS
jgi:hypothetical protein